MHRRVVVPMLIAVVALAACGKQQAPEITPVNQDSIDALRRAEEEARRKAAEEEARRRAEEEARRKAAEEAARARAILAEMVHYDYDRSEIRPDAQEILLRKVEVLRANPQVRLRIEGHADERGSIEYNLALGMRRANAARDFLVGYGIEAERLSVVSYGEERPLDPGHTEEAWARNRRAEFHITAGDGELKAPAGTE